ncbi:hypothetical protein GE061_010542 [Apolygus lucorum]|uniref:C-type lectin domain-containing protein n=1 Tax=Apolygus lucorum TaxID=248454 RepID=A0A8S9XV71_APOLU|nr:hypothetical protein GE061_010542 [Apolygus lucorum]
MIAIPIVFFFIIQSVGAETDDPAMEDKYFQCKADLKTINEQNESLEGKAKVKDKKILELLKKKEKADHCNPKFTALGEGISKVLKKWNKRGSKHCTNFEGLPSKISEITSKIVHELQVLKKSTIRRQRRLVWEVKTHIYPDMMSMNTEPVLTEYDCKTVKRRYRLETNRILRIIERKKWPLDRFQKVKAVDHYADGCKLRRPYVLFREAIPWDEAMLQCTKKRMSFATVKSKEDAEALEKVMKGIQRAWVGGIFYRKHWVWPDGPLTYTKWMADVNVLKNKEKDNNCFAAWSENRTTEALPCSTELYFVCQSTGAF